MSEPNHKPVIICRLLEGDLRPIRYDIADNGVVVPLKDASGKESVITLSVVGGDVPARPVRRLPQQLTLENK